MEYDVFISYSRRDYLDENGDVIPGNIISKIKDVLKKNGITYWIDEDGINSGDEFARLIIRSIKDSKILLFVSTENSNNSEWMKWFLSGSGSRSSSSDSDSSSRKSGGGGGSFGGGGASGGW